MGFFIDLFVSSNGDNNEPGEVTEWLKVLAWKASVPLDRGTPGSNPGLSAIYLPILFQLI